MRTLRIGDLLKEYGYVTDEQIAAALEYQKDNAGVRFGTALLNLGFIQENQLLQALGTKMNIQVIDLAMETVDLDAVGKIPKNLARKYQMLAIREENGSLKLALNDPMNFYGIEDIRQLTGDYLELCLCEKEVLSQAIEYYYSEINAKSAAEIANASADEQEIEELIDISQEGDDDTPIINLLNRLIARAYATSASDVHVEPFEKHTLIRMRIDGSIVEYVTLQKQLHNSLIARIKILGDMDIAERRVPQDGHFRTKVQDEYLNVRVSVIPTVFGEKAVLRLLLTNTKVDFPNTFGMDADPYNKVKRMIQAPNGIIYFTGPTGSGKTTTLYMILEELSRKQVNIVTIEDPVEKNLPKINQTQVNTQAGLTFEVGLRSLLRQDPDIMMVGETRDVETAAISARSAITGHLVLSTLHTNDAASSIVRLKDMGLAQYMVASSLVGIVAQRLMRKICPDCYEETEVTMEDRIFLDNKGYTHIRRAKYAKGCPSCNYTGYKGRIAVHEVLVVDQNIKQMINAGASAEEIKEYARSEKTQGMKTLEECGMHFVEKGVTTLEELKKISFSI
ncbi:MAG: Flp pilus assembly complex ATPase component TadA [Blautia sp.]|nr:Flp pilus assembly complex ATPase component TadA [Blautia sp.]